jgi:hypothetical protein
LESRQLLAVIASSSFETQDITGLAQYVDTGDPAADHALLNNPGQYPVNFAAGPGDTEIGHSAYYTNTRGDVGLTDGDYVGLTSYTGTVGSVTDGTQGYQIQDADGLMTVTMDAVDLSSLATPAVSLDAFLQETGWEAEDRARIWVEVDGGAEIDLLNTAGSDIDDLRSKALGGR